VVENAEGWRTNGPLLLNGADNIAGWCRDLDTLQTAGKQTGGAGQRAVHVDHFLLEVIKDTHVEGSRRTTAIARAAVVVLRREIDLLTQGVLDRELVVGLETSEGLEQLDLLLN